MEVKQHEMGKNTVCQEMFGCSLVSSETGLETKEEIGKALENVEMNLHFKCCRGYWKVFLSLI